MILRPFCNDDGADKCDHAITEYTKYKVQSDLAEAIIELYTFASHISLLVSNSTATKMVLGFRGKVFKFRRTKPLHLLNGPRQANLVLIAYASSEGSGEPAHPRSLARTFAARSYKQ